jgi:UDP-N-acetylglucosamine 4,6-dehydratase
MNNKKIFITGGAGFLGTSIVKRYYKDNEITIYSRDEAKHYYLKKQYPKINCVIGDVKDYPRLKKASKNHNIGIFAASLKQIEAVDQNVEVGIETIINGAVNSRRVAEENNFEAACFISSDKSRAATTLYGAMKFVGGELFIVNSETTTTRLSTAVYGNVLNSTGSIIPLIWNAINNNYELTLYSTDMTRFMIDADEAVDLIEYGLSLDGFNIIPNLKSFRVKDLFELYKENFGLRYKTGKPRISEKLHEMMFSHEESPRIKNLGDKFIMHYKQVYNDNLPFTEFTSDKVTVSKSDLNSMLEKYKFFNPGGNQWGTSYTQI